MAWTWKVADDRTKADRPGTQTWWDRTNRAIGGYLRGHARHIVIPAQAPSRGYTTASGRVQG